MTTLGSIFLLSSILSVYGQGNDKNSTETLYPFGPLQFSTKIDIGIMIAIAALVVALFYNAKQTRDNAKQVANNAQTNEAQFWLSLRDFIIQHHDDIHRKLIPGGPWSKANSGPSVNDWPDVEAYMGVFEHIYNMLDEGLISDKIFKSIYKYRLINILNNNTIKKEKLEKNGDQWSDFIALCRREELGSLLPPFLFVPITFTPDRNHLKISFQVRYMESGENVSKAKIKLNFSYPSGISQEPLEKETDDQGKFEYSWLIEKNDLSPSGDVEISIQVSKDKFGSSEIKCVTNVNLPNI